VRGGVRVVAARADSSLAGRVWSTATCTQHAHTQMTTHTADTLT
jgi:hypothetical protein